jgi:hypothetical protein
MDIVGKESIEGSMGYKVYIQIHMSIFSLSLFALSCFLPLMLYGR